MSKGKVVRRRRPVLRGVMAIDPGGTTGVAWGAYDGTVVSAKARIIDAANGLQCGEVKGTELEQAARLCGLWKAVRNEWLGMGIGPLQVALVMEDFVIRGRIGTTERVGLAPVRIGALLQGMLWGQHGPLVNAANSAALFTPVLQSPSDAMRYATSARLKAWGLWQVGSDHKRDAARHWALYVARNRVRP